MNTQSYEEQAQNGGSFKDSNDYEPFITGSMLPLYYSENRKETASPILTDLERISTLREKGLLSEEEFNLCKTRLFKVIKI